MERQSNRNQESEKGEKMKTFSAISSIVYIVAALIALWMHDAAFSIACCAMSGLCRLDAQLEDLKKKEEE